MIECCFINNLVVVQYLNKNGARSVIEFNGVDILITINQRYIAATKS